MSSMEELLNLQNIVGENIQRIIRNFKKDSTDRKAKVSYFEERLHRLSDEWSEFNETDTKLRILAKDQTDMDYLKHKYYDQIQSLAQEYIGLFETEIVRLKKEEELKKGLSSSSNKHQLITDTTEHESVDGTSTINSVQALVGRINVRMMTLQNLLNGLSHISIDEPQQFYAIRIDTIKKLWNQVETLYDQIWERGANPTDNGLNQESYECVSTMVMDGLTKLQVILDGKSTTISTLNQTYMSTALPLPKVSIPKFDGDYVKWVQFHDIFLHMIHLQQIPDIQKMWYLKSNLTGEAERFISHLSTTEDNYQSAWTMLKERYNNRRILVTTLVDKILNQPSGSTNSNAIKKLHDTTRECLLALNNIGIETKSWSPLLYQILIKRLDRNLHMRFEQSLNQPKEVPSIEELLSFLEFQFQTIDSVIPKQTVAHKTVSSAVTMTKSGTGCNLCNRGVHALYQCTKFLQLSESDRLRFVQSQKLCFNCFKGGHSSVNCSSRSCKKCNKKHNTLLHIESSKDSQLKQTFKSVPSKEADLKTTNATVTSAAADALPSKQDYVLLATARVTLIAPNGNSAEFRAILDSGSQVNLISEYVVKRLGISTSATSLCIDGVGSAKKRVTKRINVKLQSRNNKFKTNLEAFVIPTIIPHQPTRELNISKWQIPNLELADPYFYQPGRVDILLGAEYYFSLIQGQKIELSRNLPMLLNSSLGWIISGKISSDQDTTNTATCAIFSTEPGEMHNEMLNDVIERLWRLDDDDSTEKNFSQEEQQCELHFVQNTRINNDGRFVVRLPFHENPSALGNSIEIAHRRFLSLERRLMKDPLTRNQYINFMNEYEQMGHMTEIDPDSITIPNYVIPHHCVLKPDSTTTKLRVVFDASAKSSSGYSLNDTMYTGPITQSDLFAILIRFRLPKFVFTTDIEKMYRQILINQDDRKYQMILWRNHPSEPIKYYQLNTVTYGTRAAPYLATRCLRRIALENEVDFPLGAQILKDNFYVDDGLGGSNSLSTAIETQRQLIHILRKHGFCCHKWSSNNNQLLQNIPQEHREVNLDFNSNDKESIKTLGLIWLPKTDHLCIKVKVEPVQKITKRTISSDLARLFDPLGLLAPIVVTAKIFIQELWQAKLSWDEALPDNLSTTWASFRENLNALHNLNISRHIFKNNIALTIQLHVFADASEKAYGAAAYIRSTFRDGRIVTQLLCSKSRVAPLKKQTLPRLELCAAVLAAELSQRLRKTLQIEDLPIFLWSDSEIVLSWIHSQSTSFQTFVGNRISKIQTLTLPEQWRHVKSKDNPADVLSRGVSANALSACHLWFLGPLFLHGKQECWPAPFRPHLQIMTDVEKRKSATIGLASTQEFTFVYNINHKNSFRRLQRILSYVCRFIRHTTDKTTPKPEQQALTTTELNASLKLIIRAIQSYDFRDEINQLKNQKEVNHQSSICSLTPFLHNDGTLRVGGRLEESNLSYDCKHPMILPYNDALVKLLFKSIHEDNKHCSPQALLGIIRQRYWPIKGKSSARSTVQKCVQCSRARPKLCQQIMGNLPQPRVTPARPFINSGVDYFGPLWIHYKVRGKRPTKAYVAVFCCFATKAVHFELVSDLSTDAYIGALKRFVSRRGRCQNIYSDNATNFVGANNKLAELSDSIFSKKAKESIISTCSSKGIQFHFIPPRAPHFGGLWEAAVKSAKGLLIRSVSSASLTYEELETVVIEIEAILNSRPLTPISNDPSDMSILTPGHFLIGEALTSQVDDCPANSAKLSRLSRWELVSRLKHDFWKRWSNEYLHELQQRHKWKTTSSDIKPGDMIIIKEDNTPTMKWPLGRILKVYTGSDGSIRVADIKTASGTCKRPIHRLALLPIDTTEELNLNSNSTNTATDDQNDEPKGKRLKLLNNNICTTLLTLFFILPIIVGEKISNERFGPKLGIHFEEMASTYISTSQWNLIVYYDLSAYWTDAAFIENQIDGLTQLCRQLRSSTSCLQMIEHLKHSVTDLNIDNKLLHSYNTRQRRGAIDFVGNVANSLFGVLDSEYAKKMSSTIMNLQENDSFMLKLIKDQTTVINSTINIFKQGLTTVKSNFVNLQSTLNEVSKHEELVDHELYRLELENIFNMDFMRLLVMTNNLQKIQTCIVDVLTDIHHGKFNPLLLTPTQLDIEIQRIKTHLPQSLELPVPEEELLEFYKLMKVKGGLTETHVVFTITLPLIDHEKFKLYNLIPVPNIINNTMSMIETCSPILAINEEHRHFFPVSSDQLKTCNAIHKNIFICYNVQLQYNYGAEKCSCEINLFNNITQPTCMMKKLPTNVTWTPLIHKNHWIYSSSSLTQVTAVCGREIIPLNIEGSGLLTISPDCILKHGFIHMSGQQLLSTTTGLSYTSLGNISELSYPTEYIHTIRSFNNDSMSNQIAIQLNKTKELQQRLEMINESKLQPQPTSVHGIAIAYSALIASLITIILISIRSILRKKAKGIKNSQDSQSNHNNQPPNDVIAPSPSPRKNFTIQI